MSIMDIFGGMDEQPRISHEGQIARIREMGERFRTTCPFEVGDLVTPRIDAPIRSKGEPALVVELRRAEPDFAKGEEGTPYFGCRWDMRVARIAEGDTILNWVESVYYQPYEAAS